MSFPNWKQWLLGRYSSRVQPNAKEALNRAQQNRRAANAFLAQRALIREEERRQAELEEYTGIDPNLERMVTRQEGLAANASKQEMNAMQAAREEVQAAGDLLLVATNAYERVPKIDLEARQAAWLELSTAQRNYEGAVEVFRKTHKGSLPTHPTRRGSFVAQPETQGGTRKRRNKRKNRRRTLK